MGQNMSKIVCPSCKRKIPKSAGLCPKCGAWLGAAEDSRKKPAKRGLFFWLVSSALFICLTWAMFSSGGREISESTAVVICGNAFDKAVKAETKYALMSVVIWNLGDSWLVKFPAKVRFEPGVWTNVVVHCRCVKRNPDQDKEFNPDAVVEFEVMPRQ